MYIRYQHRRNSAISFIKSWARLGPGSLPTWALNAVKWFEIRNHSGDGIYYVSRHGSVMKVSDIDNGVYR